MNHMIIGNIWNKLGQQLRDDRDREAWVAANGEVLARLQRRGFSILSVHEGEEVGLAGTPDPFVLILVELSEDSEAV